MDLLLPYQFRIEVLNMAEMVRVNTRISVVLNEWLDKRSDDTGVPKSTLIFLALEQYMQQTEAMGKMGELNTLLQKLNELEKKEKNLKLD